MLIIFLWEKRSSPAAVCKACNTPYDYMCKYDMSQLWKRSHNVLSSLDILYRYSLYIVIVGRSRSDAAVGAVVIHEKDQCSTFFLFFLNLSFTATELSSPQLWSQTVKGNSLRNWKWCVYLVHNIKSCERVCASVCLLAWQGEIMSLKFMIYFAHRFHVIAYTKRMSLHIQI